MRKLTTATIGVLAMLTVTSAWASAATTPVDLVSFAKADVLTATPFYPAISVGTASDPRYIDWSDSSPLSSRNGKTATAIPIYGAQYHTQSKMGNYSDKNRFISTTGIETTSWGGSWDGTGYEFFYWKKENFLNDGNTGTVTFSADSKITYGTSFGAGNTVRALVRDGSQFYVSSTAVAAGTTGLTDLNNKTWYSFNPVAGNYLSFVLDTTQTPVAHTFTDVTAIGFYNTSTNYIAVSSFTANGLVTAVPEPATMALLGLGAMGALLRRRRNVR